MKCGDSEQCSKVHDRLADVAHNHVVRRDLSASVYYFFYVLYVILYDILNYIFLFVCIVVNKNIYKDFIDMPSIAFCMLLKNFKILTPKKPGNAS